MSARSGFGPASDEPSIVLRLDFEHRDRFVRLTRVLGASGVVLVAVYVAFGLALATGPLLVTAGVLATFAGGVAWARRSVYKGEPVERAAAVVAYGLLATVVAVTPFFAFAHATLVVSCL